ncbi:MAG: DUF2156 domain-containing protein [Myxococcales bacterium]|nr:DUF2156 domain-containing protein [Myxococcales bacterium]
MSSPADRWRSPLPDHDRRRVLALLDRHPACPTAFQILERGNRYWFAGSRQAPRAAVGYVEAAGFRVVAGAPIGPREATAEAVHGFVADAAREGRRVAFFSVGQDFVDALEAAGIAHDRLPIGTRPDLDPQTYTLEGTRRRSLRSQVHRAVNKGVRVRRIDAEEVERAPGSLRAEIERVLDRWLAARRMAVMRFMVDLEPFTLPERRRYYIAERGDEPVGFLAAVPAPAGGGWFFEDVIRVPDAPNGTAELLMHTALLDARARGDTFVTLGLAPLAEVDTAPGPHRLLRRFLRLCVTRAGPLYDFEGVRRFKARFRPTAWTPQWLVTTPGPIGPRALRAVLTAFADGGLLRFGGDTARRLLDRVPAGRWALALRLLAAGLVPWTVLLALADGKHWFGDASIQAAWVTFDAGMTLALWQLARSVARHRPFAPRIALLLAGATLTDFVLSTVQALHLHRAVTGWAALFVAAGLGGPFLATLMLAALAIARPPVPRVERDG